MSNRVKEINGVKVINRYSFAVILTGLLSLLATSIPVLIYFLFPVLTIKFESTVIDIKGLDLIQGMFLFKNNSSMRSEILDFFHFMDEHSTMYGGLIEYVFPYFFLGSGVIYSLMIIWAVISLFYGIVFIAFGKSKHYKNPYKNSWGIFIFTIILCGIFTALGFFISFVAQLEGVVVNCLYNYDIILICASFLVMLILGIVYVVAFKHKVYIKDAMAYEVKEEKLNPSEQVTTESLTTIPSNIKSIGGHSFAENMQIQVADIPNGIKVIGEAAFANALNLELVTIPTSVKVIKFNAFFNCKKLTKIVYSGTKDQWKRIKRGSNWLAKAGTTAVNCEDGQIVVNPF